MIIGAGGAGARAAIEAATTGKDVVLVCRSPLGRGGLTPTANGGYHAAVWPDDSPKVHAEDLVTLGCSLNDRNLVDALAGEALEQARLLEKFGAKVNWDVPPKRHDPQIRYPRSLFVPGREVLTALRRQLRKFGNVALLEDHLALQLLVADGQAAGALIFNIREGNVVVCESKTTVMAAGSLGEMYPLSAQEPMGLPTGSTGSGYVLAGRAGADLVDMEMIQFVAVPLKPSLIAGMRCLPWAPLKNAEGREFLPPGAGEYSHEAGQAIYRELREGRGPVTMDLPEGKPPSRFRHPLFGKRHVFLHDCGVTPYQRPVTVGVSALTMMGGVHINERCETTLPGLYAAGEVAGNVHGARRVSGNAFPEIIVFGARAGKYAALEAGKKGSSPEAPKQQTEECLAFLSSLAGERRSGATPRELRQRTQAIMGDNVQAIRNGPSMKKAQEELRGLEKELPGLKVKAAGGLRYNPALMEALDVHWLVDAAGIVCRAALLREESRGFHFREDFPEEKEAWLKHTVVRRRGDGWVTDTRPVVI